MPKVLEAEKQITKTRNGERIGFYLFVFSHFRAFVINLSFCLYLPEFTTQSGDLSRSGSVKRRQNVFNLL